MYYVQVEFSFLIHYRLAVLARIHVTKTSRSGKLYVTKEAYKQNNTCMYNIFHLFQHTLK